jgi:ceramide glucosyltransferase
MLSTIAIAILAFTCLAQATTIAIVVVRLRRSAKEPQLDDKPGLISIIRPICGVENHLEACLESSFQLSYPNYEVIFCVEDETDEAIPLAQRAMKSNPAVPSSLLIGRDQISANPKLNNIVKGWRAAKSDQIILSDSNTLLPPDYIERLLERWDDNTGMTSMSPGVTMPEGFASIVECAYINGLQARWILAGDSLGIGYALGKTLMYHRPTMERLGGLPRLGHAAAEDIASTHAMRDAKLDIHLTQKPIQQPLGRRTFRAVVKRQIRWARLRRSGLRWLYLAEILNGGLWPVASATGLAIAGVIPILGAVGVGAFWYGAELVLMRAVKWPTSWSMPAALVVRDLLLLPVWVAGLFGNRFDWRGNVMTAATAPAEQPSSNSNSRLHRPTGERRR